MQNNAVQKSKSAERRFLRLYEIVREREPYLNNSAKIVQYGALLRYFLKFMQNYDSYPPLICEILYQVDIKLGDIYYEEALQNQDNSRYFLAIEYYSQALIYARQTEEKNRVLSLLKDIYYYIDDKEAFFRIEKNWADNHEEKDRFGAFILLARNTGDLYIKTYFLECALDMVMAQDEGFYAKYQDTLDVCCQLTVLYELLGEKDKIMRIKNLRENTLKLLN